MMLGARVIRSQARGLSPRARDSVVDSPYPPLLSKREHCRHSQPCALFFLLGPEVQRVLKIVLGKVGVSSI